MRVLVTGGAGFIGSHLCDYFILKGHQVVVVDNLTGGRLDNLSQHLGNDDLEFHQVDIRNKESLNKCFKNIDWVVHLAGLADIVPSIEAPEDYFTTNVLGTLHVLECARTHSVKRFVYAASSSCYGIPDAYPTAELAPIKPQYPYALTKHMGEELVLHWCHTYHIPTVSLRLFNVYGPRVRTNGVYGAVFGVFLAQKAQGKAFTVVGDGSQTRDFTYVTDVTNAFWMAVESNLSGEVLNVGSGDHYSINRLVELLGGEILYIPERPGEPKCTFADINSIKSKLGWGPKISFSEGVARMLENVNDWNQAPLWDADTITDATKTWFHFLGEQKLNEKQLKCVRK